MPSAVVRGSWFVARGPWFVARGSWLVARGSWLVARGPWFVARGSLFVAWQMQRACIPARPSLAYTGLFPPPQAISLALHCSAIYYSGIVAL